MWARFESEIHDLFCRRTGLSIEIIDYVKKLAKKKRNLNKINVTPNCFANFNSNRFVIEFGLICFVLELETFFFFFFFWNMNLIK